MISVAERSDDHHQYATDITPGSDVHYISFYSDLSINLVSEIAVPMFTTLRCQRVSASRNCMAMALLYSDGMPTCFINEVLIPRVPRNPKDDPVHDASVYTCVMQ